MLIHHRVNFGPTDLIVCSSSACTPNSCWGRYRRIAVLRVDAGATPRMISSRAKGVREVVATREKLRAGGGNRTAFARSLAATIAAVYQ